MVGAAQLSDLRSGHPLTTNTEPNEGEDKYWAFEATASKRYANGWSLLGVGNRWDRRDVLNINPRNPNEAAYRAQSSSGTISLDRSCRRPTRASG